MTLKPEAEVAEIREYLSNLKKASWLGESRRWWPDYLFHCTDILNVVNILRNGELLSRTRAKATRQLQVDIASPEIIAQTNLRWQNYVRLYFRPKAPTQFRNESFRPLHQQELGAHCPVPVYLLFDAISVLARVGCLFTDGNAASSEAVVADSIAELKQIPFDLVYHDTWFEPSERDEIIYHRHAEVLVPERLGLGALRFIGCRSQAEYTTLLSLLPPGTLTRWKDKIGVPSNLRLFHRRWSFVRRVEMDKEALIFRFNRGTEAPGPFDARVVIVESPTDVRYIWQDKEFLAKDILRLKLTALKNPQDYSVSLDLDGHLALAGRYQEDDLPF
jgi:hypothetical protein